MSLLEFHLLVIFESSSQFPQIFSERVIFKSQFVDLLPIPFDVINHGFVAQEKIELRLQSMVLFVDKVYLCVQLLYDLLVVLLEILHCQFFVVLTSLIKLTESQNFRVSNLYALLELLNARLQRLVCFFEIFTTKSNLV
jgi:hypothetical protein